VLEAKWNFKTAKIT